jgi:hypothetical protein
MRSFVAVIVAAAVSAAVADNGLPNFPQQWYVRMRGGGLCVGSASNERSSPYRNAMITNYMDINQGGMAGANGGASHVDLTL